MTHQRLSITVAAFLLMYGCALTASTYTYTNGLGFGTDVQGHPWNVWGANGSNVWSWGASYNGGYLHYSFKVLDYADFYCSGSCRYHNIWSKDPTAGFELADVRHDHDLFPESNENDHQYQVDVQWSATGYRVSVFDLTSNQAYSDQFIPVTVTPQTFDSWTWGTSLWSATDGSYVDETPTQHATQWTATVYGQGPTGVSGGGGDIRTDAMRVTLNSPSPPVINSFTATPLTIQAGSASMLAWSVSNATSVSIDKGIGPQPTNGSIAVTPATTTTYLLTATGPGGTVTATTTVTVTPACSLSCSITVPSSAEAKIAFSFSGSSKATSCSGPPSTVLSFGDGNTYTNNLDTSFSGTHSYNSPGAYAWSLTVTQGGQTCTKSGQINVSASAPVINFFTASPAIILPGSSSTLTWSTTNALSVSIDNGIGSQQTNGSVSVRPVSTTTYTLTASGGTVATTAPATVTIGGLGSAAAALAKGVVGGDYASGAKGWDWGTSAFVDAIAILSSGYHWYHKNTLAIDNVLDCSGLVFWSYNRSSNASRYQNSSNPVFYEGADAQYRHNTVPIDEAQLSPGDLMFFHFEGAAGFASHVAMYVGCCGPNGEDVISASSPAVGITWRTKNAYKTLSGFLGFKRVSAPQIGIRVLAHSPIDLVVIDPDGHRIDSEVTITTSEEVLHEVPGVLYYSPGDLDVKGTLGASVVSPTLKAGSYLIQVVPRSGALATDTYSVEVQAAGKTTVLAANVMIQNIPREGYGVAVNGTTVVPFNPSSRHRAVAH